MTEKELSSLLLRRAAEDETNRQVLAHIRRLCAIVDTVCSPPPAPERPVPEAP